MRGFLSCQCLRALKGVHAPAALHVHELTLATAFAVMVGCIGDRSDRDSQSRDDHRERRLGQAISLRYRGYFEGSGPIMIAHRFRPLHLMVWTGAIMTLTALAMTGPLAAGKPESSSNLAGSWSGGGWVSFASGKKESARCRAHYSRAGDNSYQLSATCATASGTASQTATVYQVSPNRFRGSFHNVEYNVSGTIRVVVQGSSQSVTLAGDSGSASLNLNRH